MSNGLRIARRTALKGAGLAAIAASAGVTGRLLAQSAPGGGSRWATGGTSAMRGAASYPDPFQGADIPCRIICEQILGPCYAPSAPLRQDISEGEGGIPVRMALRLLASDGCSPLERAEVEVWHTSPGGVYSAPDVQGGAFCTDGDAQAEASYFFRGRAISDGEGRILFDSCYPGWYGGRALHVHLLVRMPEHAGETSTANLQTVTQLYFPEELTREVCATVEGYVERGQPNVSNATDNVLRGGDEDFLFAVERMDDGAMLASKTIVVALGETCGNRGMGSRRRMRNS